MLILEVSKKTHWGTKTVRSTILITGGNKFAESLLSSDVGKSAQNARQKKLF